MYNKINIRVIVLFLIFITSLDQSAIPLKPTNLRVYGTLKSQRNLSYGKRAAGLIFQILKQPFHVGNNGWNANGDGERSAMSDVIALPDIQLLFYYDLLNAP